MLVIDDSLLGGGRIKHILSGIRFESIHEGDREVLNWIEMFLVGYGEFGTMIVQTSEP